MTVAKADYRLGYRGDIEGLRAIAILLVVACHAKVPWLAGGYVGVDVFYVLSGYLITGLLIQEVTTTGTLRFASFYARRLRRLRPALLLMVVLVGVAAWLLLAPSEQGLQAAGAGSAALWLSNFFFAFTHQGYFDPSVQTNLFLHTWSLGVEEQFYLVWPLLVAATLGIWHAAKTGRLANLKWLFGGLFVASFALSWYWTQVSPLAAFYMMPSRAWQFSLGALVFLFTGSPAMAAMRPLRSARWLAYASWCGLAAVLLAALILTGDTPYPGTWSLLPTVGAALAIAGGAQHRGSVARLLSMRPLQGIGKVSYAWYIWHWPVLLLGDVFLGPNASGWARFGLVVLSFAIAIASYRFFETPIRHNRRIIAKPGYAIAAGFVLMATVAGLSLGWRGQAKDELAGPLAKYASASNDKPVVYAMGCDSFYHSAHVTVCPFGKSSAGHTAVLMGDSVAAQWVPALRMIFARSGWRLLVIMKSGCPMVDAPYAFDSRAPGFPECVKWRQDALQRIAQMHPDVLVMSSTYDYPFTTEQWRTGTTKVLNAVARNVGHMYVIRATPRWPYRVPVCLEPRSALYERLIGPPRCEEPASTPYSQSVATALTAAIARFPNVSWVDMNDAICPKGVCRGLRDGTITYMDNHHITATYARSLAPTLAKALGMPTKAGAEEAAH